MADLFIDSAAGNVVTVIGNVVIDTTNKKFGTGAAYSDGTYDEEFNVNALSVAYNSDFNFGSNNFTIDLQLRMESLDGYQYICGFISDISPYTVHLVMETDGSDLTVSINDYDFTLVATGILTLNTYSHIALVRYGNTFTIYAEGVSVASGTYSNAIDNVDAPFTLFNHNNEMYDNYFTTALIDEVRISNEAAFITEFTPPSAAYSSGSTVKLLLHCDLAEAPSIVCVENIPAKRHPVVSPSGSSVLKMYLDGAWTAVKIKKWDGIAWTEHTLKYWDVGTSTWIGGDGGGGTTTYDYLFKYLVLQTVLAELPVSTDITISEDLLSISIISKITSTTASVVVT
jgi:hypothetical protein